MRNLPSKGLEKTDRAQLRGGQASAPRVRSANLTYRIVEELGVAVVTGTYSETNPFPVEADLCKQFGVSRSILREAVKMLTAKGLLGARPRQGTWVQPEDNWNLLDPDVLRWLLERKLSLSLLTEFTQMRLAVEPIAANIAAQVAGPEEIAAIYANIDRMAAAESGDDDPLNSDISFHVSIMRASGNRFYFQLCDLIDTALRYSIRTTNYYKGVRLASVVDHKKVADAIAAHDSATAESAMRAMMQEAIDLIRAGEEADEKLPKSARRKVTPI
jgi:DNA-binding FadR family transcriptional regulator